MLGRSLRTDEVSLTIGSESMNSCCFVGFKKSFMEKNLLWSKHGTMIRNNGKERLEFGL